MCVYMHIMMCPMIGMLVQRNCFLPQIKNNNNQPYSTSSHQLKPASVLVLLEDSQLAK